MENSEILEQIKSGDKDVIKTVYKENAKDIYNFVNSIVGDHDASMDVTKKTFVKLFSNIQSGEEPTNIRLAALKIAYDESCKVALPSSATIDSPFDREDRTKAEQETAKSISEEPVAEAPVQEEIPQEAEAVEDSVVEAVPAAAVVAETEVEPVVEPVAEESEMATEVSQAEEPVQEDVIPETIPIEVPSFQEVQLEEEPAPVQKETATEDITPVFDENVAAPAAAIFGSAAPAEEVAYEEEGFSMVMSEENANPDSAQVIDISMEEKKDEEQQAEVEDEPTEEELEEQKKKKKTATILIVINIILVLILLWLVYGLLENFGVLPESLCFDLGYTWFNETIYPIF